jgi:replicative DNA helicase
VVLLDGDPGDSQVEFRHLKFSVSEIGPMKVNHEQRSGLMSIVEQVDLFAVAQAEGQISVKRAAELLFGSTSRNHVEKARRQLEKLVTRSELVKKDDGGASNYYPLLSN